MSTNSIRPQALIFTLFGDYVHARGGRIWIGSLVELLSLFGVSEQAVRTTVSRMTRSGWLASQRVGSTSFYALTAQAQQMLDEGAARIFQPPANSAPWDHSWHLVTYSIPEDQREARDTFRRELMWHGYGMLANTVWISAHRQQEQIAQLVARLNLQPYVQTFTATLEGFVSEQDIVVRSWDLQAINAGYQEFIAKHRTLFDDCQQRLQAGDALNEAECFVRRFNLIHDYRRFPFRDPHLPIELVPPDWCGVQAANFFREYHQLLAEPANRYFDSVYTMTSAARSTRT
ncbi:MAG: phenylacetic acid degradation operon negative regulatory protein PaaX [Chloroflexi bacterium]|nr:phenylacetic acid degradation operon negative regulatory protein PaaX [Chloroflexota bacterium]